MVEELPDKESEYNVGLILDALNDKLNGRITHRELMESVIIWSYYFVFEIGGYRVRPKTPKPFNIIQFDRLDKYKKDKMSPTAIDSVVKLRAKWLDNEELSVVTNERDLNWLHRMVKYFTYKNDEDKVFKIQETIKEYERVMYEKDSIWSKS